ncbi:multidrug effflux MFS transporter [Spelaeicoccus albus]|uniref:DHA1 family bicyclomycin/chloramphenicol resistance-like MFS transporter n=1 Tax=Spelaeicoccus albus TaxID=1280376 RepID=A0A7Z0D1N3_9MICO|nr:multidrug effflux MFS transporter [Spelaeicoccus albus]NYI67373.1 DHA1 family bicyclomycin/chloramphenicol resistance-like MFS transporter [Spelaeicoccus albus]
MRHVSAQQKGSHRGLIVLLGLMSALGPMTVDMYLPALPQITHDFATSEAAVQTTLTGSLLGMAAGQLVLSPITDALGRRWPLIAGLGIHVVFSVLSALAPGIGTLIIFRALQGAGSAAAPAIAVAIIRDISTGREASIRYSAIMFVSMVAPIVAPLIGSGLLLWTDWHGIFLVQAAMSMALAVTALFALPETQPHRQSIRQAKLATGLKIVTADRVFVGSALSQAAMMAASFCYISGLSFVAQDWYGVSEQSYGLILTGGAVVMLFMNRLGPLLIRRFSSHRVALIGLAGALTSSCLMMIAAPTVGLAGVAAFSWLCIGFQQLVTPNNRTMGLARHPSNAGIAAALMGASALSAAAISSPLMGLMGVDNGFMMALGMFSFYGLSLIASTVIIGFRHEHVE